MLAKAGVPTFSMNSGLTTEDFGWGSKNFHKMVRAKVVDFSCTSSYGRRSWGADRQSRQAVLAPPMCLLFHVTHDTLHLCTASSWHADLAPRH